MEFRRIPGLPPYVFTIIDSLKSEARRAGRDIVDLGFGNPDVPSPDIAVEKLAESARIARNHRYSLSKGLPKLREAADGKKSSAKVSVTAELPFGAPATAKAKLK